MSSSRAAPSLVTGIVLSLVLSGAATAIMAWPVIRSPRTLILGQEIAGRHHDPFTVMQQFAAGGAHGIYQQPLTDQMGVGLARVFGPIAAYNLLVLLSFPLTALTTYLLGRYLWRDQAAALAGAMAFTFAPAHIAHAIYHVHIAQTHWLPLYLLALFAAVDQPTPRRLLLLLAAASALVLSNDYAGLVAAIITPVALPAYWFARRPTVTPLSLLLPATVLGGTAIASVVALIWIFPELTRQPDRLAFWVTDLTRYGARWWAYFSPPVYHPLFGEAARDRLRHAGLTPGTVELQLSLSWSLVLLATASVATTLRSKAFTGTERGVLAVAVVAVWGFIASLAPFSSDCSSYSLQPACLGYRIAPMFRAYARVGVVTSLCISLLAGYCARAWAISRWLRTPLPWLIVGAFACAAFELWPWPGARDVLPTQAHRAIAGRTGPVRVLDCIERTEGDSTLLWLMKKEIRFLEKPFEGCDDPLLVPKLTALEFGAVIVRTSVPAPWPESAVPNGLKLEKSFPDARLYRVSAITPAVVVLDVDGFSTWEGEQGRRWRWMSGSGQWTVFNTLSRPVSTMLTIPAQAFEGSRQMAVDVDGRWLSTLEISAERAEYTIGPLLLSPGSHRVRFSSADPAKPNAITGAYNTSHQTVRFYEWQWDTRLR